MPRLEKKKPVVEDGSPKSDDVIQPPQEPVAPVEKGEKEGPATTPDASGVVAGQPPVQPVDDTGGMGNVERVDGRITGNAVAEPRKQRGRGAYKVVYHYSKRSGRKFQPESESESESDDESPPPARKRKGVCRARRGRVSRRRSKRQKSESSSEELEEESDEEEPPVVQKPMGLSSLYTFI